MKKIDVSDLKMKPIDLWLNQWLVLCSGANDDFNAMTVAWGSLGGMWTKPFVQIVVRPCRYTYEFLEKYDTFTLNAFPKEYKKALNLLGTKSGRDSDKIKESGLTVMESDLVQAPSFQEAELILECKKVYFQDMDPKNFLNKEIAKNYPLKDYHRIYFGEILAVKSAP